MELLKTEDTEFSSNSDFIVSLGKKFLVLIMLP